MLSTKQVRKGKRCTARIISHGYRISRQYFVQDCGQGHYNAMSGQSFRYDHGQGQPQDPKTNSMTIFSGFHFAS